MREEEKDIDHQFDVWHFCKSIKVKLLNAAKEKACKELKTWIKSICNHFWWSCATCERDKTYLKEKRASIVFHIQNKHRWTRNSLYHQYSHSELSNVDERWKNLLSPKSQAFEALQSIVFDKTIVKDMAHLTQFSHTGVLEVYHFYLINGLQKAHTSLTKAWLHDPS